MEFEKGVAEIHTKKAITASNPNVVKLLKNLGERDEEHYGFLRQFAFKRGIMFEEFVPPVVPIAAPPAQVMDEEGAVLGVRLRK